MNFRVQPAVLGLGLLLPLWLLAQSSTQPAPPAAPSGTSATSAPASKPAGLIVIKDKRTGSIRIGEPSAPLMDELFLFNGKRTVPAPVQIVPGEGLKLPGFSGKYPVPVGAAVSGPVKGTWGIYADVLFDVSRLDPSETRGIIIWHVLSTKGERLASIGVNVRENASFYVSPQYVVYASDERKVQADGPFATFLLPVGAGTVTVLRDGTKMEPDKSAGAQPGTYTMEKVTRDDLIEWEIAGDNPAKGMLRPIVLGSEPGLVEYYVASSKEGAATRPAGK